MQSKLVKFSPSDPNIGQTQPGFSPTLKTGTRSATPLPKREQQICAMVEFISSVK
jgi:hypothetical protein